MIVSWNWLKDYIPLPMSPEELAERLAMSGLNHESTETWRGDWAIDLEVTSNRGDCLGQIGVAREVSVLWDLPLSVPDPRPRAAGPNIHQACHVAIEAPDLCPRYTARVLRGVRVGASPPWLIHRLQSVFLRKRKDGTLETYQPINNVVDITNYVMMECGQPLHAFDLKTLAGGSIRVRRALAGEALEAIDHRTYALHPGMCVIADAQRPVALAGVMGGSGTEVSETTTDLLIESAEFAPLSVRSTARSLRLHSPSSYRFERGVDPAGIDWASRRCCELILEHAGGTLCEGVWDLQPEMPPPRAPIVFRLSQLPRILGIQLDRETVVRILTKLGLRMQEVGTDPQVLTLAPPSWRRDLSREIDLVEEVARIHGYDKIPEDVGVPMAPSYRSDHDRLVQSVRSVLVGSGFREALTASLVVPEHDLACSPWTKAESLRSSIPALRGADRLRRSLLPSLLSARQVNQSLSNPEIELYEIAKVYLPRPDQLPDEPWLLGLCSGGDFRSVKGVIEGIVAATHTQQELRVEPIAGDTFKICPRHASCQFFLADQLFGFLGEVDGGALKEFGLRSKCTVAELRLDLLLEASQMIPQHRAVSPFPAMVQDLTLIVEESVSWRQLKETAQEVAGPLLDDIVYRDTYRDEKKDGPSRKRLTFSLVLRSLTGTLTGEQADGVREAVIAACGQTLAAQLC